MPPAERPSAETGIVTSQIGREPRGPWRIASHCRYGYPSAIAVAPLLDDGTPFPTLYWLTCPFLVSLVAQAESDGEVAQWAAKLAEDSDLAGRMRQADSQYCALRLQEGEGSDPCSDVGIAGQTDSCATKCLHSHVAAFIAGVDDPIGFELVTTWGTDCGDQRCAAFVVEDSDE